MQTILWEAEPLCYVKVRRHCKKCGGKTEFLSSGLFRVNANKKRLDVWLVYRCASCGASWNLPLHERVNPKHLPKARLDGFLHNSTALAQACAMDAALLKRHGCEVAPPDFAIAGPDVPKGQAVLVEIRSTAPLDVRVDRLLRQKLGLSAKQLAAMLANGSINPLGGAGPRRQKLSLSAPARFHIHIK